jgi:hypothetical protein
VPACEMGSRQNDRRLPWNRVLLPTLLLTGILPLSVSRKRGAALPAVAGPAHPHGRCQGVQRGGVARGAGRRDRREGHLRVRLPVKGAVLLFRGPPQQAPLHEKAAAAAATTAAVQQVPGVTQPRRACPCEGAFRFLLFSFLVWGMGAAARQRALMRATGAAGSGGPRGILGGRHARIHRPRVPNPQDARRRPAASRRACGAGCVRPPSGTNAWPMEHVIHRRTCLSVCAPRERAPQVKGPASSPLACLSVCLRPGRGASERRAVRSELTESVSGSG